MSLVEQHLREVQEYVKFLEEAIAIRERRIQELEQENMHVTQKYLLENTYK